jgi:hypothetical protein
MDEKPKRRAVTVRISEDKWRRLKMCLLKNDTTMQRSFESYIDRYVAAFEAKEKEGKT